MTTCVMTCYMYMLVAMATCYQASSNPHHMTHHVTQHVTRSKTNKLHEPSYSELKFDFLRDIVNEIDTKTLKHPQTKDSIDVPVEQLESKVSVRTSSANIKPAIKAFEKRDSSACSHHYSSGVVSTPYHPALYNNDLILCYVIRASEGKSLWLTFTDMDIEYEHGVCYDLLYVFNGDIEEGNLEYVGEYCGSRLPLTVISKGRSLTLVFESDLNARRSGFRAEFNSYHACGQRGRPGATLSRRGRGWIIDQPPKAPPERPQHPSPPIPSLQIVQGTNSDTHEWPWQVSLRLLRPGSEALHMCGGSIVGTRWIITAAHCLFYNQDNPNETSMRIMTWLMEIVVGDHDTSQISGRERSYYIQEAFTHPDYNQHNPPYPYNNDIALIRTNKIIQFDATAAPVCLSVAEPSSGSQCWTTGWGATIDQSGTRHKSVAILQKLEVPLMSFSSCSSRWQNFISPSMVCAFRLGYGACQGDSGGPLVCLHAGISSERQQLYGNMYFLEGTTSWGSPACASEPSVFTRVPRFSQWISDTTHGEVPVLLR